MSYYKSCKTCNEPRHISRYKYGKNNEEESSDCDGCRKGDNIYRKELMKNRHLYVKD